MYSTAQRALWILEIMELILSFVDKETAKSCARVCRFWAEPALNAYWRCLDEVEEVKSLLSFLLPSRKRCRSCPTYSPLIHFHEDPNHSDWTRFLDRSKRVRHLELHPLALRMEDIVSNDVFEILARSRPPGVRSILPRLLSLGVQLFGFGSLSNALQADLIFHEGIRELALDLAGFETIEPANEDGGIDEDDADVQWPRRLLADIARLSPNITTLSIDMEEPVMGPLKENLCDLLVALKGLEQFTCSMQESITTRIVVALRRHRWLRTIAEERSDREGALWADPSINEDVAFPALECLQCCSSLADTPLLFECQDAQTSQYPHLLRLWIRIIVPRRRELALQDVFRNISWHCPNLEVLRLSFSQRGVNPANVQITGRSLWPLRHLRFLRTLQISRVRGLEITDAELAGLVANLPTLNELRVGHCHPDDDDEDDEERLHFHRAMQSTEVPSSQFTLNLIALLSTIPNQLEEIAICINLSSLVGVGHQLGNHLKSLQEISFGASPITSCPDCLEEIARFLAIILHKECNIYIDDTVPDLAQEWGFLRGRVYHIQEFCHLGCARCTRFVVRHWHRPAPWINGN